MMENNFTFIFIIKIETNNKEKLFSLCEPSFPVPVVLCVLP